MEWLIPSNMKYYDVIGVFEEFDKLNWKQSVGIEKGDIVYIYIGKPIGAIKFKCIATKVNLGEVEIDDSKYTRENKIYSNYKNYMELTLVDSYDDNLLNYNELKNNGLTVVQGPNRISYELSNYIRIQILLRDLKSRCKDKELFQKTCTEVNTISKERLGQNTLRTIILNNYDNKCAICGLSHTDLLNCSHIVPWSMDESNRLNPENAICLCAMHDRLFDRGYFSLNENYDIVFSDKADAEIKKMFSNTKIRQPKQANPNIEFLKIHYDKICNKK